MRADEGYRFSRKACFADRIFVAAFAKKHLSLNIVFRVQTVEAIKPHSVNLGNVSSNTMTVTRIPEERRKDYLEDHIPYRLNSLRAWDILEYRRLNGNRSEEVKATYQDSPVVDPALEISIVFGRSLLNFLGLTLRNDKLDYYVSDKKDDVQIWDVIPGKQPYPIDRISTEDQKHLCNLIKVANKASAHLTTKTSTSEEFASLIPARDIIFRMTLEYTDNIKREKIWWCNDK